MLFVRGIWFFIVLSLLVAFFMARPYLYAVQQDNYRIGEIFKSKRIRTAYFWDWISVAVFSTIFGLLSLVNSRIFWGFFVATFFLIAEITLYFVEEMPDKKKPMRYTRRAIRAFIAISLTAMLAITLLSAHINYVVEDAYLRYATFFALPPLFPLMFIVTMTIMNFFERLNNRKYERRTAKALAERTDLIKIAITGSYGKTSVKNYLSEILSAKYRVLATPASYNTPMGIAKSVAQLDASHDVFIAEMGARRVGDIKKLMKIVKPDIGVLTGINAQHLETFHSQENIAREKKLVVQMCDGDAFANSTTQQYFSQNNSKHSVRMPIFVGGEEDYVRAGEVGIAENGSVFNLYIGERVFVVTTKLLGRHNIENLLLAAAVALELGVEPEQIVSKIKGLQPVEHRLQLICANGIKIIDDTFNGNPDGARCAIEVLQGFVGRKIAVTPGLVELGEREIEENYKLGRELASVCDLVILVGEKRTAPIKRGLVEGGYKGKIAVYSDLASAQNDFSSVLHLGDVLLLLNDLPDIYAE